MVTATITPEEAAQQIVRFVRPGFTEHWRKLGRQVGYRQLGRALRYAYVVPEALPAQRPNGHRATRKATNGKVPYGQYPDCPVAYAAPSGKAWRSWRNAARRRNPYHQCGPECMWDAAEIMHWCNTTPYPTKQRPPLRVPSHVCVCGQRMSDHYTLDVADDGRIKGYRKEPCYCDPVDWYNGPPGLIAGVRAPD